MDLGRLFENYIRPTLEEAFELRPIDSRKFDTKEDFVSFVETWGKLHAVPCYLCLTERENVNRVKMVVDEGMNRFLYKTSHSRYEKARIAMKVVLDRLHVQVHNQVDEIVGRLKVLFAPAAAAAETVGLAHHVAEVERLVKLSQPVVGREVLYALSVLKRLAVSTPQVVLASPAAPYPAGQRCDHNFSAQGQSLLRSLERLYYDFIAPELEVEDCFGERKTFINDSQFKGYLVKWANLHAAECLTQAKNQPFLNNHLQEIVNTGLAEFTKDAYGHYPYNIARNAMYGVLIRIPRSSFYPPTWP